jgi:hypothetical protein
MSADMSSLLVELIKRAEEHGYRHRGGKDGSHPLTEEQRKCWWA